VRERLVGALVLVAIVVLFVPAILRGRDPAPAAPPDAAPTKRVEVQIDSTAPAPEEQVLVPEPALPDAAPAAPGTNADAGTAKPAVAPPPAPSPKPASEAAAPPAEPRAAPAPAVPGSAWAVQLGAFSNQAKAEQLVAELRKRRYAAFVLEYRAGGQVLYRVRVGPEQDRARAVEIAARLAKDGFEPVVARHP
jgi:DedD protein